MNLMKYQRENGLFKKAVQPCPEPVEGKAAADVASGAYTRVRGNGTQARTPLGHFFNIPHF